MVDVVESETSAPTAHVGGSPLNVAVGLSRLEHDVVFVGRHGNDEYGRMISRALRSQGITSLLEPDELPTSIATATLDPTGQASYEFALEWVLPEADALTTSLREAAQSIEHVHTGSLGVLIEPGATVVKSVIEELRASATISYDPNYRPTIVPNRELARQRAEEFVALADVVQASTDDLDMLYPERSHYESMVAWMELGPALVTVTRGASGAMALADSGYAEREAYSIDVADTVGAGDSFMAATLSSLRTRGLLGSANRAALHAISSSDVAEVLNSAARAASITSSRFGAQPPTAQELADAMQNSTTSAGR